MIRHPSSLEIITPSYAPDFELCRDLVESSARSAPAGTVHRVIVQRKDRPRFEQLRSDTVVIEDLRELLPRGMLKVPLKNAWLQARRPWPPVRGWIVQQIAKLAAAASSPADHVLLVDSDVVFIRPFSLGDYADQGSLPLFRLDAAVHEGMSRHIKWDEVARDLLGLPAHSDQVSRPDYICCPCLWKPEVVRAMLARVEQSCGVAWQVAVGSRLHFSEMVLYGVFVDEVLARRQPVAHRTDMKCTNHYLETPLDAAGFKRFLATVKATDVAVMVSAKSGTPPTTRRTALARFARGA